MTPHPEHRRIAKGSADDDGRDEAQLVSLARGGDAAALDRLFEPHLARAFVVARRIAGSRLDAQDLLQDACLRAIEQLDRFTPGRPFGPWFLRLVVNLGLNQHKAARVRTTETFEEGNHSANTDPHRDAEASEFRARFATGVNQLSPRQRVIVIMFEVDGYSSAEIAAMLGISADTVRWHLHHARAALRRSLADFQPTGTPEE
ncbi:MAG: RNA polymerase sigma factor [Gemmatimonadaceae bacterium]